MNAVALIIILIVIIICILGGLIAYIYNRLTDIIIRINETEALIDTDLRSKYDLINRSISIIKGNTKITSPIFDEIIRLRSRKISNFDLDRKLINACNEFIAIKEKYPELGTSDELKKIATELDDIDNNLENLRTYYNENITTYNKLIKSFPTNIIAVICKNKEKLFYDRKDMTDEDYNDFKL